MLGFWVRRWRRWWLLLLLLLLLLRDGVIHVRIREGSESSAASSSSSSYSSPVSAGCGCGCCCCSCCCCVRLTTFLRSRISAISHPSPPPNGVAFTSVASAPPTPIPPPRTLSATPSNGGVAECVGDVSSCATRCAAEEETAACSLVACLVFALRLPGRRLLLCEPERDRVPPLVPF